MGTAIDDPTSPEYKELNQAYQATFKKEITLPWFVATGFDGLKLIALAMERGGFASQDIKDELYKIQGYRGACRLYSFTPQGSAPQLERMFRIVNGVFTKAR